MKTPNTYKMDQENTYWLIAYNVNVICLRLYKAERTQGVFFYMQEGNIRSGYQKFMKFYPCERIRINFEFKYFNVHKK